MSEHQKGAIIQRDNYREVQLMSVSKAKFDAEYDFEVQWAVDP